MTDANIYSKNRIWILTKINYSLFTIFTFLPTSYSPPDYPHAQSFPHDRSPFVKNKYLWYYIFKVYFKSLYDFSNNTHKFHLKLTIKKSSKVVGLFFYEILSIDLVHNRVIINAYVVWVIGIPYFDNLNAMLRRSGIIQPKYKPKHVIQKLIPNLILQNFNTIKKGG
jgi:hypothetical protein